MNGERFIRNTNGRKKYEDMCEKMTVSTHPQNIKNRTKNGNSKGNSNAIKKGNSVEKNQKIDIQEIEKIKEQALKKSQELQMQIYDNTGNME